MKTTCDDTTLRMIKFIFADRRRRRTFCLLMLAPHARKEDPNGRVTLDDFAMSLKDASYEMRRVARVVRSSTQSEFRVIGNLSRVDWVFVAHLLMCQIDPKYASLGKQTAA